MLTSGAPRNAPGPAGEMYLRDITGIYRSLSDWRGSRLFLIFVQPECPFSKCLLGAIAGVDARPSRGVPVPIVVSTPGVASSTVLPELTRSRLTVMLQDDIEVALRLGVHSTPSAVLLDERGNPSGPVHIGAGAILRATGISPSAEWSDQTTRNMSAGERLARIACPIRGGDEDASRRASMRRSSRIQPTVSVVMCTRDRPGFLQVALECYRRQTYAERELIVVDDGSRYPVDASAIRRAGGRLIRMADGTPIGAKLNRGVAESRGSLCQKWDDDDWHARQFLETMVALRASDCEKVCRPRAIYVSGSPWFDLARWRVLDVSCDPAHAGPSGGSLLFAREDWELQSFRELRSCEDVWFLVDQAAKGIAVAPVDVGGLFMYVRHDPLPGERGHVWTHWWSDGKSMDEHMREATWPVSDPDSIIDRWALSVYQRLRASAQLR